MGASLMMDTQAFPGTARLDAHSARRVPAARHARWLHVLQGDVWLTTDGHGERPGEDVWLSAGESWLLDRGASVVLQGEPAARFQLVEDAPLGAVSATRPSRAAVAWQGLRAWLQRGRAPAPCAAC